MKKLSLRIDRLNELTPDDLRQAGGGTWTGQAGCVVSFDPRGCVTSLCTVLFPNCIKTR